MTEEIRFQVSPENCPGFSIPDRGGKFIAPARNSEWKRSGKWFCASLWWYHEVSLARRSQTSWGDVDYHKWVEVGRCWACGCSICKHQCLELDVSCNREPVQGDKERCNMGPFGFAEDQSCRCILNNLRFDCVLWTSSQKSIAVVQSWNDKGLDKKLCCMRCKERLDLSDVVQWFLIELDRVIVEELSWMVKPCCRVGVAGKTRSSVFARLSCRWCSFIHAEMSVRQPEIRAATVGSSGWNERYSCVISIAMVWEAMCLYDGTQWCSVCGEEEGSKNRFLRNPSDQLMFCGYLPSTGHLERLTSEIGFKPAKWNPSDAQ